ncbi:MAG: S8 family serine peptidase, partial [Candidatus Promineifilaceae bacterium]
MYRRLSTTGGLLLLLALFTLLPQSAVAEISATSSGLIVVATPKENIEEVKTLATSSWFIVIATPDASTNVMTSMGMYRGLTFDNDYLRQLDTGINHDQAVEISTWYTEAGSAANVVSQLNQAAGNAGYLAAEFYALADPQAFEQLQHDPNHIVLSGTPNMLSETINIAAASGMTLTVQSNYAVAKETGSSWKTARYQIDDNPDLTVDKVLFTLSEEADPDQIHAERDCLYDSRGLRDPILYYMENLASYSFWGSSSGLPNGLAATKLQFPPVYGNGGAGVRLGIFDTIPKVLVGNVASNSWLDAQLHRANLPISPISGPEIGGHGTFVLSQAGKLAPFSEKHLYQVLGSEGYGSGHMLASRIFEFVDGLINSPPENGAVIVLSLGTRCVSDPTGVFQKHMGYLERAIAAALDHDTTVIAAAGNAAGEKALIPARWSNVIAVAAHTMDAAPACYSSASVSADTPYQVGHHTAAFGGGPPVTGGNCRSNFMSSCTVDNCLLGWNPSIDNPLQLSYGIGTSFAAPQVAGLAAWLRGEGTQGTNVPAKMRNLSMAGEESNLWDDQYDLRNIFVTLQQSERVPFLQNGTHQLQRAYSRDVLAYNQTLEEWALYFRASEIGFTHQNSFNMDALTFTPDGDMLFSILTDSNLNLPDPAIVNDSDIVQFAPSSVYGFPGGTQGTVSILQKGVDLVNLSTDREDIDALHQIADDDWVVSLAG